MTDPLVTAIVSTYRAERFMRGCLEDLVAQTLGDRLEILVIDSNSPEGEGEIVREFQRTHANIRYVRTDVREETTGAFNRAIGLARGKYLTTANTDDRHRADALEVMARALEQHPQFGIVYADSLISTVANERFEDSTAQLRYDWPDFSLAAGLSCCLFGAQPLWRRDVHESVGLFSPDHLIANDQDMFLRIAWKHGAVHLRETLGVFLQRPDSNSGANQRHEAIKDVVAVMRRYRLQIPLEDIFPALRGSQDDPIARAAALFELGNLCALGPYNDYRLALECYARAVESPVAANRFKPQFSNNAACVLFCMGISDRAVSALEAAEGCEHAAENWELFAESLERGTPCTAAELAFASIDHPVVRASRMTSGLRLAENGDLEWTPARAQVPWEVYEGPNGVPVEPNRPVTIVPATPQSARTRDSSQRVMIVMYGWADSGGGTILPRQVARAFAARGHDVTVFSAAARPDPELPAYAVTRREEDGVALFTVHNRPAAFMDLAGPEREIDDPRVRGAFEDVLAEQRPNVVHFFNLHNLGMSLPSSCRARGIATVFSSNNYWPICPRLYLIDETLNRCPGIGENDPDCAECTSNPGSEAAHAARAAAARQLLGGGFDAHLAVSQRVRDLYIANGADPDAIEVMLQQPQSVDEIWRSVGSKRTIVDRLEAPLRVGFIGSLLPHKGAHVLVKSLQAFPRGPVRCVLHGDVDLEYARVLQQLDQNGCVEFGGAYTLAELPARLADVDIVVVPSVWEDCAPFVVAEALAARAPVIGSRIGGIPDFIEPGRTGVLFDAGDPNALARSILPFLEDRTLLGRMQRAIGAPSGFEAYLDALESVYARVRSLERSPRPVPVLAE